MSLNTTPGASVGMTLGYKIAGASSYTILAQLGDDLEFDGFDTTSIAVKLLSSTVVAKTPGRTDYGNLTGTLYFVMGDASDVSFLALAAARTMALWEIQIPDDPTTPANGSTVTFSGFVQNVKPGNFSGEDVPTLDFTIAISGAVTFTPGT